MNKREEVKTLLDNAIAELSKTTLGELAEIETMAVEARFEEYDAEQGRYEHIIYSESDKTEISELEKRITELREAGRRNFLPDHQKRMEYINKAYESLFWNIKASKVRIRQMKRAKTTDKEKKSRN